MKSVTVAGIDCGTNSIRLKIARVDDQGMHEIVPRILRVIRLGQDVDKTHRFAQDALDRAYTAAAEFAGVLAQHPVDAIRFVATSATRDAVNRDTFEDGIEQILGVRPEVIPGTEEADLSFLGATSVVSRGELKPPYLVVDLGGGSTELVLGGDGHRRALHAGTGRVLDGHWIRAHDRAPPAPRSSQRNRNRRSDRGHRRAHRRGVPHGAGGTHPGTIIGVSGTVTTMSALALGLKEYDHRRVDGVRIPVDDAYAVDDRFLRMTREQRRAYKTHPSGTYRRGGGGARRMEPCAREGGPGGRGRSWWSHRLVCGQRTWPARRHRARLWTAVACRTLNKHDIMVLPAYLPAQPPWRNR